MKILVIESGKSFDLNDSSGVVTYLNNFRWYLKDNKEITLELWEKDKQQEYFNNQYDILFLHSYMEGEYIKEAFQLKIALNIPLVYYCHSFNNYSDFYKKGYSENFFYWNYYNIDSFIFTCQNQLTLAKEKLKLPFNGLKAFVSPNSFCQQKEEMLEKECDPAGFRKKYALPEGLLIGFIGGFLINKGIIELFEVMDEITQQYNHVYLCVASLCCPNILYQKLLDIWLKHNKNIIYLDRLSSLDVLNLTKNCQLMVMPSISESFGQSVMESMYRGKITIATDTDGGKTLIKDGYNGFLVPVINRDNFEIDKKCLKDKILYCIKNKEILEKNIGKAAEQSIREKYLTENVFNDLLNHFDNVIKNFKEGNC